MSDGLAVQLAHDEKETTFQDHGYVRVKGSNGKVLAESSDFQHNKSLRRRRETGEDPMKSLLSTVQENLSASAPEEKPEGKTAGSAAEEGSTDEGSSEEASAETKESLPLESEGNTQETSGKDAA
jgi:hypothetical protein